MTESELVNALQTHWAYHLLGLRFSWDRLVQTCDRALDAGLYSEFFRRVLYDGATPPDNWHFGLCEAIRDFGGQPLPWPLTPDAQHEAVVLFVRDQLVQYFQAECDRVLSDARRFIQAVEEICSTDPELVGLGDFQKHFFQWHYFDEDDLCGEEYEEARSRTISELVKSAHRWLAQNPPTDSSSRH